MRVQTVLFLCICAIMMGGCAQMFKNKCKEYGYTPGTSEFARCVERQQNNFSNKLQNMGKSSPSHYNESSSGKCVYNPETEKYHKCHHMAAGECAHYGVVCM